MEFFDFLFLNPICLLVGEAIKHNLFGNGCPMPHGFGQFPVEFGSSAVGVSAARASPVDSSGFDHMEMYTPITAFADVAGYPVNVDGIHVELLRAHSFRRFLAKNN
jgi:hypothetical protein